MDVILIAALTADGLIAQSKDQVSTAWTSKADRAWFAQTTREIGVVIMGWNTFLTMGKPLADRLNVVYSLDPASSRQQYNYPNLEFTDKEPLILLQDLGNRGYKQMAICGGATIYTMFMRAKLVNRLFLSIEPVIFGEGIRLLNESLDGIKLKLVEYKKLGDENTILLEYKVINDLNTPPSLP